MKIYSDKSLSVRNDGLKLISSLLDKNGITHFLFMGVLLGAIRDNNFIKWDWDVELGCFSDTLILNTVSLTKNLDELNLNYEIVDTSHKNFKLNIFYKGNKYSLWGLYKKNNFLRRSDYLFPIEHFLNLDEYNFRGKKYNIPSNVIPLLEFIYGNDWFIPKKTLNKNEYLNYKIKVRKNIIERIIIKVNAIFNSKLPIRK